VGLTASAAPVSTAAAAAALNNSLIASPCCFHRSCTCRSFCCCSSTSEAKRFAPCCYSHIAYACAALAPAPGCTSCTNSCISCAPAPAPKYLTSRCYSRCVHTCCAAYACAATGSCSWMRVMRCLSPYTLSTRLVVGQNLACFTQAAGNAATSLQGERMQQQQQCKMSVNWNEASASPKLRGTRQPPCRWRGRSSSSRVR
jgi:hypothetical protein